VINRFLRELFRVFFFPILDKVRVFPFHCEFPVLSLAPDRFSIPLPLCGCSEFSASFFSVQKSLGSFPPHCCFARLISVWFWFFSLLSPPVFFPFLRSNIRRQVSVFLPALRWRALILRPHPFRIRHFEPSADGPRFKFPVMSGLLPPNPTCPCLFPPSLLPPLSSVEGYAIAVEHLYFFVITTLPAGFLRPSEDGSRLAVLK